MPSNIERAYQCEACDLDFNSKEEQDKHTREKHTDKPSFDFEKTYRGEASEF